MSSGLSAKIFAKVVAAGGNPRQIAALQAAGVPRTPEFNRILALPRRRPPADHATVDNPQDVTDYLRAPGGTMTLRPLQAAALIEAAEQNGCFIPMGVGEGKTLVSLLLPEALASNVAVLLLPPTMKAQLFKELAHYGGHFRLPTVLDADGTIVWHGRAWVLHVVAYTELSSQKKAGILEAIAPDLVIADEAHNLRNATAARTKRFMRYMRASVVDGRAVRFVAMSGTMTARSILDYAHLADLCLGGGSPVPRSAFYRDSQAWAAALDPGGEGAPGALELLHTAPPFTTVRDGFHRRLVETPGVIASRDSSVGASLIIRLRRPTVPKVVQDALTELATTWVWDGTEYDSAMAIARIARSLSAGYFLRWQWGTFDDQPTDAQRAWLEARNGLSRAIRGILQRHSSPGFDSPGLVVDALRNGGAGLAEWDAWLPHENTPEPAVVPVWVDDFLVRDAVAWAGIYKSGIIWAHDPWLGQTIAARLGVNWFGANSDNLLANTTPDKCPILVASARAHGTGKNLQAWSRNYVATPMSGADAWQQLIGRTHRPGQLADEVEVFVNIHTPVLAQAWENAREKAAYIQATMGDPQRILYATIID